MPIYDRAWYRDGAAPRGRAPVRMVHVLIAVNVGFFLLSAILWRTRGWDAAAGGLGLIPDDVVGRLALWQLVTSMFLHVGPWHLFFNMFVLWMFGLPVEDRLGRWPFLRFYLGAGVAAGVAYVVLGLLARERPGMVGASGAVMGALVYYTCVNPRATVYLFFMVPMKMIAATALIVGLDLFFFVFSGSEGTGVAHTAHLGGALYGFLYYLYAARRTRAMPARQAKRRDRGEARQREELLEMQEKVDRLLDRISARGIDSLSRKERKFLNEASRRLREGRRR